MQFIVSNVTKKMSWGLVCLESGGPHMHSSSQGFVGIYVWPTNQKYSDDAHVFVLVLSLHSAKQKAV